MLAAASGRAIVRADELHRGRSIVLRAELAGGETYVVKLAPPPAAARERAWYRAFAANGGPRACRLADVEIGESALVFAIDPSACDARAYALAQQRLPPAFGGRLGTMLAELHARTYDAMLPARIAAPSAWNAEASDGRAATLVARCAEIHAGLEATAPIHGDVRWENAVVSEAEPGEIVLIDWEDAGLGAPAWDVGCMFASFTGYTIRAEARFGAGPGADALRAIVREHVGEAWKAYRSARAVDGSFLRESVRCAAVRLGESALAPTASHPLERERTTLVDAALAMIADPFAAARELGIDDGTI
jgi:aminoglycoside phosphotransferase (APT) family kinase protein